MKPLNPTGQKLIPLLLLLITLASCKEDDIPQVWEVSANVSEDSLTITATISDFHGDFIHMSIRKADWDNEYTIERSPADGQPERDWSRVHHWFRDLHPNTYLEGRIDDGSGDGPSIPGTFIFKIPIDEDLSRQNYADKNRSHYEYITRGYSYADGNSRHPTFSPGNYEIAIYPWYTGSANILHLASDGKKGVQYIHYELSLTSTTFVIE